MHLARFMRYGRLVTAVLTNQRCCPPLLSVCFAHCHLLLRVLELVLLMLCSPSTTQCRQTRKGPGGPPNTNTRHVNASLRFLCPLSSHPSAPIDHSFVPVGNEFCTAESSKSSSSSSFFIAGHIHTRTHLHRALLYISSSHPTPPQMLFDRLGPP
jgi:hypothetical protein